MNLFFESNIQKYSFLLMVLPGFAMAAAIDFRNRRSVLQILMDIAVLLGTGIMLLVILVFCRENTLRLYHLLGLLTGVVLYAQGIGKILRHYRSRQE